MMSTGSRSVLLWLLVLACALHGVEAKASIPQRSPLAVPSGGAAAKKKAAPKNSHQIAVSSEGASIPNEVFNLVKAIVGVGVLSLPAGNERNWEHDIDVSVYPY